MGLLNGNVFEYVVSDDLNSMQERRKWAIHAGGLFLSQFHVTILGPISGLGLAIEQEFIFSCSKDKALIWHDSELGNKMGITYN